LSADPGGGPYPSRLMAEFQWWLLLVGLVAGGGLVAVVSMDGKRREQDLEELERRAETNWIAERLAGTEQWIDAPTIEAVLRLHREYLGMPPPDAILVEGESPGEIEAMGASGEIDPDQPAARYGWLDSDADRVPDEVGDGRRSSADEDLPDAREQQAPTGEEAHAGADGEQRADR
jgi:hypothetical protein